MVMRRSMVLILCLLVLLSGCYPRQSSPIQPFISPEPMENKVKITLFFGDAQAMDVIAERREVLRKNEPMEVIVLRELIKGPNRPEGRATIPPETKLISVEVVDRIAYANFSRELVTKHSGGSTGERMTIMSIVYTLTELPGIERVQLLLEGEKKEAMFGHGTTIIPLGRPEPQISSANNNHPDSPVFEPWFEKSPALAGKVSAIALGRLTGSKLDLVAFAGGELYVFRLIKNSFELAFRMSLDPHITGIALADLTGDGQDELLAAGGVSGNYNPNVPGFIGIYTWRDHALMKLTDISRDTTPFWGVTALEVTGDEQPEVLVSNGNAMFIFEWSEGDLQQIHAVTRFSGIIAGTSMQQNESVAWRDANGRSIGVFSWNKSEWRTLFQVDGQGEWTDSVPSLGDLNGDGRLELAILDLRGFLNVFDSEGNRLSVPSEWNEQFASAEYSVSPPIIANIDGIGYLVFGQGDAITIRKWQ